MLPKSGHGGGTQHLGQLGGGPKGFREPPQAVRCPKPSGRACTQDGTTVESWHLSNPWTRAMIVPARLSPSFLLASSSPGLPTV